MSYQPQFTITLPLLARVEGIAALRERIQGATVQVPWIPAQQKNTRARNTHSSTAIEGNPLTLDEVRALEAGATVAAPVRARREVLNDLAALRHVAKQAAKKRATHQDIFRLHAIIAAEVMDQGEAGRYRTMRERMGQLSITAARELGELIAAKKIGSQGVKRGTVYLWTK
jgi:Fic family protein